MQMLAENDDAGMTVSVLQDGECQPDDGFNDHDGDAALDDEEGEEDAEEERDLEAAVGQGSDHLGPCEPDDGFNDHGSDAALDDEEDAEEERDLDAAAAQSSDLGQENEDAGPAGECQPDDGFNDHDALDDEEGEEDAEEVEAEVAQGSDLGQGPAASASKEGGKRKRVSPYFNFFKQNRETAKAQVLASGQVASVSAVGKVLGELWRKLPDVEKAAYGKENAGDRTAHSESEFNQDESMENDGACAAGPDGQQSSDPNILPFPLIRIKRIVRLDKDIRLVTRPGLAAITNAAQLFIESLASGAFSAMLRTKRKSIRLADLEAAVRSKRQFLDFLDDSMDIFTVQKNLGSDSGEGDDEEGKEGEQTKKAAKKPPLPPPGTRCITDFFGNPQSRVEAP